METQKKKQLIVEAQLGEEPEIGRWLWAFQDSRKRTMEELVGLSPAVLDWQPPDNDSSIGTVLYHIALIEADWLYEEVLERPIPPEILEFFPYNHRDDQGRLTQVQGFSLEEYLQRLELVRDLLLDVYRPMTLTEFRRVRSLPHYDVTPEYVLHHLMQHEAEHRSQIGSLRNRAKPHLGLL